MAKFIGETGLIYLWSKIKNYVAGVISDLNLSGTYVAKENGKGLSSNDYTTTEKNKLAGIENGAEANVQANWAETDSTDDAFIKNKPNIPSKTSQLTNDSGFITTADIPEGAAASTSTPLMDGTAAVGTELAFARGDHRHPTDTSRQAVISDLETIRTGASAGATAYQKPSGGIPASDMATAVQTALTAAGNAIPSTQKGAASGVATLDANGKVPSDQLPSYVDDVIEAYARSGQTALSQNWLATGSASGTVITPEAGKIYVLMNSGGDSYPINSQYRWGGTTYVVLGTGGVSELTTAEMDTATNNWT